MPTEARSSSTRRKPLSRPRILKAALTLIDREGLDGLSMRKLGDSLNVEAMSLYKHVPNKSAIIEGVVELVMQDIQIKCVPSEDWLDIIRQWAHSFRRIALAHPHVFRLILTPGLEFEATREPLERLFAALEQAGFDPRTAMLVHRGFFRFLYGALVLETLDSESPSIPGIPGRSDLVHMSESTFLRESIDHIASWDPAYEFDYHLDMFLQSAAQALVVSRGARPFATSK